MYLKNGYELTKLFWGIGTNWPKWVRIDLDTSWPGYELTSFRADASLPDSWTSFRHVYRVRRGLFFPVLFLKVVLKIIQIYLRQVFITTIMCNITVSLHFTVNKSINRSWKSSVSAFFSANYFRKNKGRTQYFLLITCWISTSVKVLYIFFNQKPFSNPFSVSKCVNYCVFIYSRFGDLLLLWLVRRGSLWSVNTCVKDANSWLKHFTELQNGNR